MSIWRKDDLFVCGKKDDNVWGKKSSCTCRHTISIAVVEDLLWFVIMCYVYQKRIKCERARTVWSELVHPTFQIYIFRMIYTYSGYKCTAVADTIDHSRLAGTQFGNSCFVPYNVFMYSLYWLTMFILFVWKHTGAKRAPWSQSVAYAPHSFPFSSQWLTESTHIRNVVLPWIRPTGDGITVIEGFQGCGLLWTGT